MIIFLYIAVMFSIGYYYFSRDKSDPLPRRRRPRRPRARRVPERLPPPTAEIVQYVPEQLLEEGYDAKGFDTTHDTAEVDKMLKLFRDAEGKASSEP